MNSAYESVKPDTLNPLLWVQNVLLDLANEERITDAEYVNGFESCAEWQYERRPL